MTTDTPEAGETRYLLVRVAALPQRHHGRRRMGLGSQRLAQGATPPPPSGMKNVLSSGISSAPKSVIPRCISSSDTSPRLSLVTCSVKNLVLSMSVLRRNTPTGLLVGLMCPRAPGERTALLRLRGVASGIYRPVIHPPFWGDGIRATVSTWILDLALPEREPLGRGEQGLNCEI